MKNKGFFRTQTSLLKRSTPVTKMQIWPIICNNLVMQEIGC